MPHSEFFEIGVAELLAIKPVLQEATIRTPGTTLNALVHMAAAMAEEVEWEGARADAAAFLDTARGDDLTRYVASEHGIARHGATSAVVPLTFARVTDTDEATVPAGTTVRADVNGLTVRVKTDFAATWAVGDTSEKVVRATAVQTGPDANVADLDVFTVIESTLSDATITVTNNEAAAGGNLAESDEDLVARVRDALARAARGTVPAIRIGCLEVDTVREASVFEVLDADGLPAGGVSVVIADATGQSNAELEALVSAELYEWRPAGCPVEIDSASVVYQDITLAVTWEPGQATPENVAFLQSAVRARVDRLDPRAAPVDQDPEDTCLLTHDVIKEVRPLVPGLKRIVSVTVPAGTVEPEPGQVIRAGTITVS